MIIVLPIYALTGLEPDAGKFFFYLLTMIIFFLTACSLAYTISAWSPVETLAIVGMSLSFLPQMVCMCVCMHVCMYVCMHACMYVQYVCMYVYMYVCMYVCMYVRMYACTYVCMYVCI